VAQESSDFAVLLLAGAAGVGLYLYEKGYLKLPGIGAPSPPTQPGALGIPSQKVGPLRVGQQVSVQWSATNAVPPVVWSALGLPPGVSMSAGGLMKGIPLSSGAYPVTVIAHDAAGRTARRTFTMQVEATPVSGPIRVIPLTSPRAVSVTPRPVTVTPTTAGERTAPPAATSVAPTTLVTRTVIPTPVTTVTRVRTTPVTQVNAAYLAQQRAGEAAAAAAARARQEAAARAAQAARTTAQKPAVPVTRVNAAVLAQQRATVPTRARTVQQRKVQPQPVRRPVFGGRAIPEARV
jgi:hypothetical protein